MRNHPSSGVTAMPTPPRTLAHGQEFAQLDIATVWHFAYDCRAIRSGDHEQRAARQGVYHDIQPDSAQIRAAIPNSPRAIHHHDRPDQGLVSAVT